MIKSVGKITLASLLAAVVLGMPVSSKAQDKPKADAPAAEAKAKATTFKGKLSAVDKTAMTLTVEEKKGNLVIHANSSTKFFKNESDANKPSTLEGGTVGDTVTGSYTKDGDTMTAKNVYWGGMAKKKAAAAPAASAAPAAAAPAKQ